jgi:hypothetical protein
VKPQPAVAAHPAAPPSIVSDVEHVGGAHAPVKVHWPFAPTHALGLAPPSVGHAAA